VDAGFRNKIVLEQCGMIAKKGCRLSEKDHAQAMSQSEMAT
jgi:hypothetical protein